MGSFKTVKAFAKWDGEVAAEDLPEDPSPDENGNQAARAEARRATPAAKLGLSYTINLNLPATSDIAVFNAIFRSLKEHLLK